MGISSLGQLQSKSARAGRGGGGGTTENVAVQVTAFHATKGKPDVEKDWLEGVLLADAPTLGLKAEFSADENGNLTIPSTAVKVRLRPDKNADSRGEHKRRDIAGLLSKAGAGDPVKVGGVVEFQNCFIDREGFLNAKWLKALVTDRATGLEHAFCGLPARIDREMKTKDQKPFQWVSVLDPYLARVISGPNVDVFEAFREVLLGSEADGIPGMLEPQGPGTPGFLLRVVDPTSFENAGVEFVRRYTKDGDLYVPEPIEKEIERFVTGDGAGFVEWMKSNPDLYFEMIPLARFSVGNKSLPSAAANDPTKKGPIDMSHPYQAPVEFQDEKTGEMFAQPKSCYVNSNVAIRRMDDQSAYWFVSYANHTVPTSPIRGTDGKVQHYPNGGAHFWGDVVTPNLRGDNAEHGIPGLPDAAKHFEAVAAKRSEAAKPGNAPAAGAGAEGEMGYGEGDDPNAEAGQYGM